MNDYILWTLFSLSQRMWFQCWRMCICISRKKNGSSKYQTTRLSKNSKREEEEEKISIKYLEWRKTNQLFQISCCCLLLTIGLARVSSSSFLWSFISYLMCWMCVCMSVCLSLYLCFFLSARVACDGCKKKICITMVHDGSAIHYKYFRLDGAELYLCKRTMSTAHTLTHSSVREIGDFDFVFALQTSARSSEWKKENGEGVPIIKRCEVYWQWHA